VRLGDTIAAISSGAGVGTRCVLRVSGPGTESALKAILAAGELLDFAPGVCTLRISPCAEDGALIMPVLAWCFKGPRSYTGEDGAELMFPGGPAIRAALLQRVLAIEGVRPAEPGEFTARAYLNGKLTPEQAEGVAAVIAAGNAEQLRAARELLDGSTGAAYLVLADELASALALVEAGIDFTDQDDVVAIAPGELTRRLRQVEAGIEAALGGAGGAADESAEPVVVLVGAPNAGKSTLFNALLGRARAVVSAEAGTTRDAVEERLGLEGSAPGGASSVRLVDLAGLDTAMASRSMLDALGQARAAARIGGADVLVLCSPWGWEWTPVRVKAGQRVVRVRTKADLVHGREAEPTAAAVCALDGWGLPALRRAIADAALGSASRGSARGTVLPRHRACLSRALAGVRSALARSKDQGAAGPLGDPEVIASDLRGALDDLGEVAGRISPDDVIGRVFATFCVGK
jgi:tRNA modification GTPase